jgi:Zn-dependent protease with chaperone function
MRLLPTILIALVCGTAHCDDADHPPDIVAVLDRSQRLRLDAMPLADAATQRAQRVRDSFDTLAQRLPALPPVELRIVRGATVAETLHGHVVVANEALGDLPESERLFILAHELGHVMLDHWSHMRLLYQKWVPGPVTPQRTDAVAAELGREGSALAYRQEFEADAFGLRTVRPLGVSEQEVVAAFMDLGVYSDTATHPGTRKRVAALRSMTPDHIQAAAPSPSGSPTGLP